MQNTPEYKRGYKDGVRDCKILYNKILNYICVALEKSEKEQAKKTRKILADEEKKYDLPEYRREAMPTVKIGEVVFTKSETAVLDIGIVKRLNPLEIYARSTRFDYTRFNNYADEPNQYGGVEFCRWYGTGIVIPLEKWKLLSKDVSTEEVCRRLGIQYWQR